MEQIPIIDIDMVEPLDRPISIVDYDPSWPRLFDRNAERIRRVLGNKALSIEHVGSTAVPGLAAKPTIDIQLVVADSTEETAYVAPLRSAGYVLRIREPNWHEHRMFKRTDSNINLHVFSQGCPEIQRVILFRDWLRANDADRRLYEKTKRALAQQPWEHVQQYAAAKTTIVEEILSRALNA